MPWAASTACLSGQRVWSLPPARTSWASWATIPSWVWTPILPAWRPLAMTIPSWWALSLTRP